MCDCNAPSLRTDTSEYGDALRKKIADEHEAKKAIVMAIVAQLVRALVCGTRSCEFNSRLSPQWALS